jgi:biotin operon repressor
MVVAMASATERLQTAIGHTPFRVLEVLARSQTPISGRMVATALTVSPTTATKALKKLHDAGFATSSQKGRAYEWRLNMDDAVVRAWLEETRSEVDHEAPTGVSPYSTGGGGVTFERKVAVQYLAHLLAGDAASELGDGRSVVSVSFQQAPEHSADDLVVRAARDEESEPSLVLAIAVRRSPNLVPSDEPTKKLFRALVLEVTSAPVDDIERRVVLVVAGEQDHASQLQTLTGLASKQMDALSFFKLVRTQGKFAGAVRDRLNQIEALVGLALVDLGETGPSTAIVRERTWELLSRLVVLMPRLETPNDGDWAAVTTALIPSARGGDLYGASLLRDRLVALAEDYPPAAATIDLPLLRRDAHQVLDSTTRRHRQGWQALDHLHDRAIASTRDEIGSGDGQRRIHLDRGEAAAALLDVAVSGSAAVVASGESGVGKSTLVVRAITDAACDSPETTQALCINLRHLPETTVELESVLGAPLATLLAELSAPRRLLVVDGADAISEGMIESFRYLIDASLGADVTVIAVAANDTRQLVHDTIAERCDGDIASVLVSPLTDAEVDDVVATFSELTGLATNPRSRELLRRPVVVDLLVRGGLAGTPLSDADAMQQIWDGLVRRRGQPDRGTPRAREHGLLRLADLALRGGDVLDVIGAIDATALDGLLRDGLLRTPPDDPFTIGPEFAHDEVRRYAVALLLHTADTPTSKLIDAGVPRWTLGAARLACQMLLAASPTPSNPLHGRFTRLQKVFDDLVDAGHGDRWGDVPGEALLTLGDPSQVLRDAWPELRAEADEGLRRLCRLVDQRLRDQNGLVRVVAVEPLVDVLLDDPNPWSGGKHIQNLLSDWLRALVVADTPAEHRLRTRLRDLIVAECAAAERRLQEQQQSAAAAEAARPPKEVERRRRFFENLRLPFAEIGYPRSRHRDRSEIPHEITDEVVVELLALLGPDLCMDGECVLRRVGRDAPSWLRPAVEELFTGRALATSRPGLLADLTEAYYLDDEDDGSGWGFHEDGIRHHRARTLPVMSPLAAWYRGPFMALFGCDFRSGVAVLNRMLNHAARVRERNLARRLYGVPAGDDQFDPYRIKFDISGAPCSYVGDDHVWRWYRGTGVGPYPCMSALQALERVCDQLIEIGMPISTVVAVLLDGCENLAMVGFVVGLLVRHIERVDELLDPYLAEPLIWELDISRVAHEFSGLAADGVSAPERRQWSIREAAMMLVLRAGGPRVDELRLVGQQLVAKARQLVKEALDDGDDDAVIEQELMTVRAWASGLDRGTYEAQRAEDKVVIQSTPPEEIVQAMAPVRAEIHRAQEATRLINSYYHNRKQRTGEVISGEDLVADLAVAQELIEDPPNLSSTYQWDPPTAVAAAALEANLIQGVDLPADALRFAVDTVLRVGAGEGSARQFESEQSYFEQGADRSAARVLPLLLLRTAATLRALFDREGGGRTYDLAATAAIELARALPNEVRVHLARGLDPLWESPCTASGTCHHQTGLQIVIETMRDCALGDWRGGVGSRSTVVLDDPVIQTLNDRQDNAIDFARLDAAIRALAPAAVSGNCVSNHARDLLAVMLAAHRRSLLAYQHNMDDRGTHALIAARALLTLAGNGEAAPVFEHIDAYADNAMLLSTFLRALSAAAEESLGRAAAAQRIWPTIVSHVLGLSNSGHKPFGESHYGEDALAALMPNPAGEVSYLYREVQDKPIEWWEPLSWRSIVEQWLSHAHGNALCCDHLIRFLSPLSVKDQANLGVPWVANLVLAEHSHVAGGSFLISDWLIQIRTAASDAGLLPRWQQVVDALVVAGVARLAPYSE